MLKVSALLKPTTIEEALQMLQHQNFGIGIFYHQVTAPDMDCYYYYFTDSRYDNSEKEYVKNVLFGIFSTYIFLSINPIDDFLELKRKHESPPRNGNGNGNGKNVLNKLPLK